MNGSEIPRNSQAGTQTNTVAFRFSPPPYALLTYFCIYAILVLMGSAYDRLGGATPWGNRADWSGGPPAAVWVARTQQAWRLLLPSVRRPCRPVFIISSFISSLQSEPHPLPRAARPACG